MPKTFCLLPNKIAEFKKALKEKDINISDLIRMETGARIELLKKYAGDNAVDVNFLFEQKLVLKNKMLGIQNALSKIGEIGKYDPAKKAEIAKVLEEWKLAQSERIFSPKENEAFLSSLAEHKMGTAITREQATNIFNLTQKAETFKNSFDEKNNVWKNPEDATKYGAAKVVLNNYVRDLKDPNFKLIDKLKESISEFKQTFPDNKMKAIGNILGEALKTVNDNTIAFVASADNSFIGRQGLNTLMTHPSVWWQGAKNSFIDFAKTLTSKNGGQQMEDALMADIYSKPNYLNGSYEKAKLLPKTEEQYPTSLPERIWGLGRVFKASEVAFKGSAIRMRTGLYDLLSDTAKNNGVNVADDIFVKDLGKVINSVTARGEGKITNSEGLRLILWAPKMLKGNIDVLTAHGLGSGLETSFARKQAFKNIAKIAGETVGVATLLNAIRPGTVETDPRSSDFLKPKFGDTRLDITGGKGSIIVLMARLLTGNTKSITTGVVSKINSGDFGASTMFDVGIDFLANKTTPPARTIIDVLRGTDANFQKTTVMGEILNKLPISVQNFYKINNDYTTQAIIGALVDLVGVNSTTYIPTPKKLKPLKSIKSLNSIKKPIVVKKIGIPE